jgi:hypothetical protein
MKREPIVEGGSGRKPEGSTKRKRKMERAKRLELSTFTLAR